MESIMVLLSIINFTYGFTLKSEYWLFPETKKEHLELNGNFELNIEQLIIGLNYNVTMDSTSKNLRFLNPYLNYNSDILSIKLGSFEKEFLYGLALNLNSREDIKAFRRLWGINVEAHYKKFSFSLLSGKPEILSFDGYSYHIENDTSDIVRFMDFEINDILSKINTEVVYGRRNYSSMPAPYSFDELFGGALSLSWDVLELTSSYVKYLGCDPVLYKRKSGYGLYNSLSFYLSSFILNLRYAYYDSINFAGYNLPPTLSHKEILLSGGSGEKGFGASTYFSTEDFNIEFEYNHMKSLYSSKYYEEYVFYTEYTNNTISIIGKTGKEYEREIEPDIPEIRRYFIELQTFMDINPLEEIFIYVSRNKEKNISTYFEFNGSLTLSHGNVSLIPGLNYITQSLSRYENENIWPKLTVRFKKENYYIDLFYGKEKGGLNCSGGICRFEPPFEGLRISFNFSL
ncbi:MAG TPA: hypothetical protein ENG48_05605 [Candidatus Atribacteria bacterium]|nr:hypothetical protein [Candidatus Atribacteria bacterium]